MGFLQPELPQVDIDEWSKLSGSEKIRPMARHWAEVGFGTPVVVEKFVLYTLLFEVIGLGCGFGPLNNRFNPPLGSILYWLRPDTIRLPPWPARVPGTKGTVRTLPDVGLYGLLLLMTFLTLFADGTGPVPE